MGCGGRWVQGGDLRGMTVMGGGVKVEKDKVQDKRPAQEEEGSPRTRRRREMYGIDLDERQPTTTKLVDPQEEEEAGEGGLEVDAGKAVSLGIVRAASRSREES